MHHLVRLAAAGCAALVVVGCGSKTPETPPPSPVPGATATPTTSMVTSAPSGASTPAPGASVDPSAAPLPQAQVTNIRVTENAGRLTVTGTLLDAEKRPVVGAVGDFFLEGSATNLVQSYATKTDGSFVATFTTAEVPPEATLMMHYRGDTANAPGTFLLRRGVPRPTPAATANPTPTSAGQATPTAATTPKSSTAARLVAFTDPEGDGQPQVVVTGQQARITGRLITPADGYPVRNVTITWKVGNDASGQTTTAADGAFELVAELPEGAHQIVLQFAGTPDRAPVTTTLTA